jgi:hypothetical protein
MGNTLYVISGHGGSTEVFSNSYADPGACGNGYQEAYQVRLLAQRIKDFGGDNVILAPQTKNCYAEKGIYNWDIPAGAQIVELHMDSASASAKGGHVIYKAGTTPDQYDNALAAFVSGIFPGRSTILAGRNDLQNVNQAYIKGYSYRLVENGFISNADDAATFANRLDDIAKGYLNAFGIPVVGDGTSSETVVPSQDTTADTTDKTSDDTSDATSSIEVDGYWGTATTKALQEQLGAPYVDGEVSRQYTGNQKYLANCLTASWKFVSNPDSGSQTVKLLQQKVGASADGIAGQGTVKALQTWLNGKGYSLTVDGYCGAATVKAVQQALNAGVFR